MKEIIKGLCKKGVIYVITFFSIIAFVLFISWLLTCGLVKLITLCFGWKFTWGIGTGIWLILLLIKDLIPKSK